MAKRAFNLPNMLTYARIIAVPLVVLCFFLEGHLKSSDFARWSALAIFLRASHHLYRGEFAAAKREHDRYEQLTAIIGSRWVADMTGALHWSFFLPALCYVAILCFALAAPRLGKAAA